MVVALKTLWARRPYLIAGAVLSCLLATVITFQVKQLLPPQFQSRQHHAWVGNSQLLVDAPVSAVGDLAQPVDPAISRAAVYGSLMTSNSVVNLISQASHIPASMIAVVGPLGTSGQRLTRAPTVPPGADGGYKITVNTDIQLPTIQIAAQAPTEAAASMLSNGADQGLINYIAGIENTQGIPANKRVIVSQLGAPSLGAADSGIAPVLFLPIAVALFVVWCFAVLIGVSFVRTWRTTPVESVLGELGQPNREVSAAVPDRSRSSSTRGYASSFTRSVQEVADLDEHRQGREGEAPTAPPADADRPEDDELHAAEAERRFKVRGAKRR